MKKIKSFKDMVVWQLASQLSKEIYRLVKTFPEIEKYALADDLLRAARSIPANISEGFGRYHFSEKIQFYNIAKGSTLEVQNHLDEVKNCNYVGTKTYNDLMKRYRVVEVKINNLIKSTAQARRRYVKPRKK